MGGIVWAGRVLFTHSERYGRDRLGWARSVHTLGEVWAGSSGLGAFCSHTRRGTGGIVWAGRVLFTHSEARGVRTGEGRQLGAFVMETEDNWVRSLWRQRLGVFVMKMPRQPGVFFVNTGGQLGAFVMETRG